MRAECTRHLHTTLSLCTAGLSGLGDGVSNTLSWREPRSLTCLEGIVVVKTA